MSLKSGQLPVIDNAISRIPPHTCHRAHTRTRTHTRIKATPSHIETGVTSAALPRFNKIHTDSCRVGLALGATSGGAGSLGPPRRPSQRCRRSSCQDFPMFSCDQPRVSTTACLVHAARMYPPPPPPLPPPPPTTAAATTTITHQRCSRHHHSPSPPQPPTQLPTTTAHRPPPIAATTLTAINNSTTTRKGKAMHHTSCVQKHETLPASASSNTVSSKDLRRASNLIQNAPLVSSTVTLATQTSQHPLWCGRWVYMSWPNVREGELYRRCLQSQSARRSAWSWQRPDRGVQHALTHPACPKRRAARAATHRGRLHDFFMHGACARWQRAGAGRGVAPTC